MPARLWPKAVFFDFDGTLVDVRHEFLMSEAERIIEELNHPKVPRRVLEEAFAAFDFFRFVQNERERFIARFWERFNFDDFLRPEPFPSVCPLFELLVGRGILIAIVTSRQVSQERMRQDLADTGFLPYLSHIQTRTNTDGHWADKTNLILEAAQCLQVSPGDVMMVGDTPSDIDSARKVGVGTTVALLSGGIRRDILERCTPDFILNDISTLVDSVFS